MMCSPGDYAACLVTNAVMPGGAACWESRKSPHPTPATRDSCESQGTLVSVPWRVNCFKDSEKIWLLISPLLLSQPKSPVCHKALPRGQIDGAAPS